MTRCADGMSGPLPAQVRDEELCEHIARVHAESFGVYGARKVRLQLNREGHCQLEIVWTFR
ncbi:MAG TPA: IS3 family transposase [Mycobacterium sp.]|nr:IS3 family transposase [Mycobacterium sp.]